MSEVTHLNPDKPAEPKKEVKPLAHTKPTIEEVQAEFDRQVQVAIELEAAKEEAYLEKRFPELVAAGRIQVEKTEAGEPLYVIARSCLTKRDAVMLGERVDMLHLFDQVKSACFLNGMVDGITKFRNQIAGLHVAAKTHESKWLIRRAVKIGETLMTELSKAVDATDFTKGGKEPLDIVDDRTDGQKIEDGDLQPT